MMEVGLASDHICSLLFTSLIWSPHSMFSWISLKRNGMPVINTGNFRGDTRRKTKAGFF
jgi:hypothetical protein